MSRCFPFPPPGYLKKNITDEVDLLKKEKQKERKHKKDKKEKRETKEKRDKEGRDGKHKEKKDKKEKHREKKKDKDKDKSKDRDKSKISAADDKSFPKQALDFNGNLHQKGIKQDDKKNIKFENRLTKQYTVSNGEKPRENHLAEENKDSKFLLELERRTRDDNGRAENQFVHKFTDTDNRKDEGTFRLVAKAGGTCPDGNEKLMDKGVDVKKIDGRGIQAEIRPIGNTPVSNHAGNFHPSVDGISKHLGRSFERNLEATIEGKEKVKEKRDEDKEKVKEKTKEGKVKEKKDEGNEKVKDKKDDKRRDKRKDKEKEKKGHGKNKDRDKEKKKEEKARERSEHKTTEQNKLKESNKIGLKDSNSFTHVSKNTLEVAVSEENLKKRKNIESNGVPRVNDNFPNKFPKLSSSHSFTDNGRILEPYQLSTPDPSYRPREDSYVQIENKEDKINGIIETKSFSASLKKTHMAIVSTDVLTETYLKSSHPDAKYLEQVYSVPKMDRWSNFDDEEWLFGGNLCERRSMVKSSEIEDTPHVWAEALHIDQADVFALPYVIPY